MAVTAEQYLKPEVIRQVARLDLRARFIIEGFIAGLHASPFQGFSVEFSEHRKYSAGDNIADIDWNVFAKTDRFYIKKFQAETNLTGFLAMDLSASMGYSSRQELGRLRPVGNAGRRGLLDRLRGRDRGAASDEPAVPRSEEHLTKFEYCISLAAALAYLMIHQQDPVGAVAFDTKIRQSLAPSSKRTQLSNILSLLSRLRPSDVTDVAKSLHQLAGMIRHRGLVMIFSDLLDDADPILKALYRLRYAGHDVILFHVLDEAEATFPFDGMVEFEDNETHQRLVLDADAMRADYLEELENFRGRYRKECLGARIDYVPLHTGMAFDKALTSYLTNRQTMG